MDTIGQTENVRCRMSVTDCFLCGSLSDRGGYATLSPRIRLAADIAPLVPGHSLMYPTTHLQCIAQYSHVGLAEFVRALKSLGSSGVLSSPLLFFEHGVQPGGTSIAGCCDHAHVHVLSFQRSFPESLSVDKHQTRAGLSGILDDLLAREEQSGKIRFLAELPLSQLSALNNIEYCWMSSDIDLVRAFSVFIPERQYIRKLAAELIGHYSFETWNRYDSDAAAEWTKVLLRQLWQSSPQLDLQSDA